MSAGGLIGPGDVLECVVNVSEGRDAAVIAAMSSVAGAALLDVHTDADHNRSVLTLAGPAAEVTRAARQVVTEAVARIDIGRHRGVHPRLGAVDVVPWVHLVTGPDGRLRDGGPEVATRARDRFAAWAGAELGLPCFLYGPGSGRSLPDLRRHAWRDYRPDTGPDRPHPTSGATCVGARPVLVAYNLWLAEPDLARARRVAAEVRQAGIRTLGLQVGPDVQVSCNLIDPWSPVGSRCGGPNWSDSSRSPCWTRSRHLGGPSSTSAPPPRSRPASDGRASMGEGLPGCGHRRAVAPRTEAGDTPDRGSGAA
jgi:glutamate formiminotransferase